MNLRKGIKVLEYLRSASGHVKTSPTFGSASGCGVCCTEGSHRRRPAERILLSLSAPVVSANTAEVSRGKQKLVERTRDFTTIVISPDAPRTSHKIISFSGCSFLMRTEWGISISVKFCPASFKTTKFFFVYFFLTLNLYFLYYLKAKLYDVHQSYQFKILVMVPQRYYQFFIIFLQRSLFFKRNSLIIILYFLILDN